MSYGIGSTYNIACSGLKPLTVHRFLFNGVDNTVNCVLTGNSLANYANIDLNIEGLYSDSTGQITFVFNPTLTTLNTTSAPICVVTADRSSASASLSQATANLSAPSAPAAGSRVICSHFYRKGLIPRDVWEADLNFTAKNLSSTTIRGYHYWGIPCVRKMRESKALEKFIFPFAMARAEELAYQMGIRKRGNLLGKAVRIFGEPICYVIGLFVEEQEWESLWAAKKTA